MGIALVHLEQFSVLPLSLRGKTFISACYITDVHMLAVKGHDGIV